MPGASSAAQSGRESAELVHQSHAPHQTLCMQTILPKVSDACSADLKGGTIYINLVWQFLGPSVATSITHQKVVSYGWDVIPTPGAQQRSTQLPCTLCCTSQLLS